jgi:hypothetical protein
MREEKICPTRKRKCNNCGKEIFATLRQIRENKKFYCSRKCMYDQRLEMKKALLICPICNKSFKFVTGKKFCSKKCRDHNRVVVNCNNCGKKYHIHPCLYKKNKNKRFYCSKKCESKSKTTKTHKKCFYCKKIYWPCNRDSKFCSVECRNNGHKTKILTHCHLCNKSIMRPPSVLKKTKINILFMLM